ncbi:tail assembly protein [Acinetobacter baumannii]|uniref:tail assembly protein n=1 Tax=Acinetobacter baumannii TaxID=470 RepID=UPI0024B849F8|nr:tail assembly protein [Acinetobacter baumannii]MDI9759738.1 tail assembly protein [Acinetobacter baumannii]HEE5774255.1 tail assembly protein [Acinetobacter baumannii]
MLKTIRLYGILAKKFGKEFHLAVDNTREAMRALCVQVQGFEKFMIHAHENGLAFAVFQDKQNIGETELNMNTDAKVIKIVPRVIGAGGGGIFQLILGAALIVGGLFTGGLSTGMGVALIGAGVGMAVGGIAMMLMPKIENQDQNQDGNKANKGFGGAVTTVAQGNPVPVLYGQREVGGFIASAGQYPEDLM